MTRTDNASVDIVRFFMTPPLPPHPQPSPSAWHSNLFDADSSNYLSATTITTGVSSLSVYGLPKLVKQMGANCDKSWLVIQDVKTGRIYHACYEKKKKK